MAVIISNLVALAMIWLSWKRPSISRLLFFLLFTWAGFTNMHTAIYTPEKYLEYADYAILPFYKDFILGFFSQHITQLVLCIAICQLLIGISMLLKGTIFKLGCWGGILFLAAILPLGFGSGSPAPFSWSVALFILYKKNIYTSLWKSFKKKTDPDPKQNSHNKK
jgi:hypothetical protein